MPTPLNAILRTEIAARGPIPFADFMARALYHPEHGYYSSGRARIGRKGDFFTNVSVGPLFGKLVAREFADEWHRLGQPAEFTIVEQGAHGGDFAADALRGLRECDPACFAATRYHIIEPSAALAQMQRGRLAGLPVMWFAALAELPTFTGLHFSNELLDAFPVHIVRWTGSEWKERYVGTLGDSFDFVDLALSSPAVREACEAMPLPLPPGYFTEVCPAVAEWCASVAAKLQRGSILLIDYGYPRDEYYALQRPEGTLSAYANHQREANPLARPGEVDLTAHVEFTSLIEKAAGLGFREALFTDQHHFMVGHGMKHFADGANASERRAFMTLMHPQFMGSAFKVLRLERV